MFSLAPISRHKKSQRGYSNIGIQKNFHLNAFPHQLIITSANQLIAYFFLYSEFNPFTKSLVML